jgi:CCR4-NOT transcription complex subunit 1
VAVAQGNSSVPRLYSPNLVQPADLVPEEPDHGTTQLLSVSAQIGTSDTFQVAGTTSITSLFPSMSSNDVPVGEPTVVTEDLGSTIPLSPTSAVDRMESVFAEPLNTEDALDRYQQVAHKIEAMIANDGKDADIQCVIAEVPDILHRCVSRDEAALAIAQKVFRNLYENASKGTSVTWILATLVAICDVCKLVVKEITSWVMYSDEEKKFNVDIITGLIRSEILNLGDYDVHIAKIIDSGRNKGATEFAISLVQTLITQKPNGVSKLYNVVDALSKLAIRPGSPESLQQLIEIATTNFNNAASFAVMKDEKVLSGHALMYKEEDDTALADAVSFQDQVYAKRHPFLVYTMHHTFSRRILL